MFKPFYVAHLIIKWYYHTHTHITHIHTHTTHTPSHTHIHTRAHAHTYTKNAIRTHSLVYVGTLLYVVSNNYIVIVTAIFYQL